MGAGDNFRASAALWRAEAEKQTDPHLRAKYETLVELFLRLAHEADKSAITIDVEFPTQEGRNTKH